MARVVVFFLAVSFVVCLIDAKLPFRWFNGQINGRPLRDHYANQVGKRYLMEAGFNDSLNCDTGNAANDAAAMANWNVTMTTIKMPIDHFNSSDNRSFDMRYQWKNTFYNKSDTSDVVFLLIGGEGDIPTNWMCFENYTWAHLAKLHGAFQFQTEHRYFGQSQPFKDTSTPNLKYLTMEQALADLNDFIPAMNKKFNLTNPRWVAFGGSYPGTMAANFRRYYPNATVGNVASSAPLWAKVDFWEYAVKMEQAIAWENSSTHGSDPTCYNNTKEAFKQMRARTYSIDGRKNLTTIFNIKPALCDDCPTLEFDVKNFMATVFGSFQGIIQYTFDARANETLFDGLSADYSLNVANLCKRMNDKSVPDLVQRIANVYNWEYSWDVNATVQWLSNNYTEDTLGGARFTNVSDPNYDSSARGWMWLSCNEFGWLQTTDNAGGIFHGLISLDYYVQMCTDLFGQEVDGPYIANHVSSNFERFGGLPSNFNASNVILPNGSLDPWSTLGCNITNNATHQVAVTTPGGAHCVDMYPYNGVEPNAVNDTIKAVYDEVAYYLSQNPNNNNNNNNNNPGGSASTTMVSMALIGMGFLYHFVKIF